MIRSVLFHICIFFFFFFFGSFCLNSVELIFYSKATLNRSINSYFSFIYLSAYRDVKMANEIKRSLLRDSTRDLGA